MPAWLTIFRKEFLEVFRDRRTVFNLIVSPLLITPLILALTGSMVSGEAKKAMSETLTVGIIHSERAPKLVETIQGGSSARVRFVPMEESDAMARIRARQMKAAVMIASDDAAERFDDNRTVALQVLYDHGNDSSRQAGARVKDYLETQADAVVYTRLHDQGLSLQLARPFDIGEPSLPGSTGEGMMLLSMFLPYILSISAILGGVFVANDSVAGEKERGTLETLLVSPVARRDIATGKFLAVASAALLNGFLSIGGLLWPFYVKLPMFEWMAKGGLSLTPSAIAAMLLVQIPLALLGAGVLLMVSTVSRNQKEAQTYLTPVLLVASVLAMLSMLLKSDAPFYWSAVPIVNAALTLKQALEGVVRAPFILAACATSLVYAVVAVVFAARLFQKEGVLLKA